MTTSTIVALALAVGIAASGLFVAWICRDNPRRALNVAMVAIGVALLAYAYFQWATKHESPEVKEAMFIGHVIAGWALVGMGFVGLQCPGGSTGKDEL
jgi:hypothetical protein